MRRTDDDETAAARAALERVERDTTGVFSSSLARRLKSAPAPDPDDRVELWGRRVGRALGLAAALLLAINLFTHWFF